MSAQATDVLIIGGGIVGAACAAALARRGRQVTLVEKDGIGGGATAAGMGHLVVMDDSEAQFALTRYSRRLWSELAPRLPPAAQFSRCGTLWVAAADEEWQAVRAKAACYAARSVRA
jgi:glycine/D-amino acid oxidase-like deaminating enzyme